MKISILSGLSTIRKSWVKHKHSRYSCVIKSFKTEINRFVFNLYLSLLSDQQHVHYRITFRRRTKNIFLSRLSFFQGNCRNLSANFELNYIYTLYRIFKNLLFYMEYIFAVDIVKRVFILKLVYTRMIIMLVNSASI